MLSASLTSSRSPSYLTKNGDHSGLAFSWAMGQCQHGVGILESAVMLDSSQLIEEPMSGIGEQRVGESLSVGKCRDAAQTRQTTTAVKTRINRNDEE